MTKSILSLVLITLLGMTAEAQRGPGGPGRGPDRGPGRGDDERGRPDRGGGRRWDRDRELIAYLNQSIRGQGTIDLNYELRLEHQRGVVIQEVIVVASSREDRRDRWRRNPPAEVSLRVDNRTMGYAQRIGDRTSEISLGRNMNLELGRHCNNLAIDIRGDDVFVSEVIVVVERRGGGGGGGGGGHGSDEVISQTINHNVRRGDDINLNYMLRIDPRDADRAEAIVVRARGMDPRMTSSVQAVAGRDSGDTQYLSSDVREFTLYLPRGRGRMDLGNIRLIVRGDAFIESVGVKLSRR